MAGLEDQANALAAQFAQKAELVSQNVSQAVLNACLRIEREVKLSMRNTMQMADDALTPAGNRMGHWVGAGPGRGHKSPSGRKWHASSEPGAAPAMDVGTLAASYTHEVDGNRGIVGSQRDTAPWLEFGTSKMGARPALNPAIQKWKETFKTDLQIALAQPEVPSA